MVPTASAADSSTPTRIKVLSDGGRMGHFLSRLISSNALWVVGGRVFSIGMNCVLGFCLARWLSEDDLGRFDVINSLIVLGSTFGMLGLNDSLVRLIPAATASGQHARAKQLILASIPILIFGLLGTLVLAPLLVWMFRHALPMSAPIIAAVALGSLFLAAQRQACRSLQCVNGHFWAHLFGSGVQGGGLTISLLLASLLLWGKRPEIELSFVTTTAAWCTCATAIAATFMFQRSAISYLSGSWHFTSPELSRVRSEVLWQTLPLILNQILSIGVGQIDLWIAAQWLAPSELSEYAAAKRGSLLIMLPNQLAIVSAPQLVSALFTQGKLAELEHHLRRLAFLAAAPSLLALGLVVFFNREVMTLAFGDHYASAGTTFLALSVGQCGFLLSGLASMALVMTGHHRTLLQIQVGSLTLFWGTVWFLGPITSAETIAWLATIYLVTTGIIFLLATRKLVGVWTHPGWTSSSSSRREEAQ